MAYNFIECNREQQYLMPPSIKEWLPEGDLSWFMIDVVGQMELKDFYSKYRDDGCGRAAFNPKMMVSLLLYGYSLGERSSRRIEVLCERDVGFRVVAANQKPDHSTISRFRKKYEEELEGLFIKILKICADSKMLKVGTIALDGTKMEANVTDPESRIMKTRTGYVQCYNAQAVVTEDQIILAADITQEENDVNQLHPMLNKVKDNTMSVGVEDKLQSGLVDAGYWSEENINKELPDELELFAATKKDWKQRKEIREQETPRGRIPEGLSKREQMERKLLTKRGKQLYSKRGYMIESVFGQIKDARGISRFLRRGLNACSSEWKLICATHNLLKLFRSGKASWV